MKKVNVITVVLFLAIGGTFIISFTLPGNAPGKYKGEVHREYFDSTVKPQDDFYSYINGTWLKDNPIPPSENSWGSFNVLADSITLRLRKLLETAAADKHAPAGSIEQKVSDMYACIMDSVSQNKQGIEPLKEEFNKIDAISDTKTFWNEATRLMKIGPDVMFGGGVEQDAKISTKEIFVVGQGGMSLPSKDYYLDTNRRMKRIRGLYLDYATQLFMQLDKNPEMANKDAQKIMNIETEMAKASMSRVELRDVNAQYNKMPMSKLVEMTPGYDWPVILEVSGIKSIDTVIVEQPEFMKHLSELVKSVPLDDWKTYLRFHLLSSEASKLGDTLALINFNFWQKKLYGVQEMKPRWKRSVEAADHSLGMLVGQLYIAKYFSPEAKEKVHSMVMNIIAAYKQRIKQVTWMSDATKQYALAKLDKVMLKLCFPDKWKDYSKLTIKRDSWVQNSFRINEFEFNYNINKLGKPVDRTEWGMSPQTVNAYYNPSMNEIVFPAAIMQPPFFDPNRDDAMNYGAMGAVIGHELTHGYDDEGSQYDAGGNLHKWWTNEDSTRFHNKLNVLIKQFNTYEIDSMHVNGELTIGENTADFGGLTIAYTALENDLKEHPEGIVDGFTPEQRFFIAWAQAWRENIRPEFQKMLININPHSPTIFRANGPLSNMPEFYSAFRTTGKKLPSQFNGFDIKPGDGMFKADSVRAAIW